MGTNKHASVRYQALNKCFSNFGKKYYIEDLEEACQKALYSYGGIVGGVKRRQIYDDINFMESEDGYAAPIVHFKDGQRTYYRYEDRKFSINRQVLSTDEVEQLRNMIVMLGKFKGLPQFDWMGEVLARFEDSFRLENGAESVVYFEQNPYLRGLEHFSGLFYATLSKSVLQIEYCSRFQGERTYFVHPYALKQYNSRWYIVGRCRREEGKDILISLAIDRIERFEEIDVKYIENDISDVEDYFDDVLGVTVFEENDVETVRLKVDNMRYNYISSKPIHHSQRVVERGDDYVVIELRLQYNYELETTLLEFADTVEILAPEDLREKVRERAKRILGVNV